MSSGAGVEPCVFTSSVDVYTCPQERLYTSDHCEYVLCAILGINDSCLSGKTFPLAPCQLYAGSIRSEQRDK